MLHLLSAEPVSVINFTISSSCPLCLLVAYPSYHLIKEYETGAHTEKKFEDHYPKSHQIKHNIRLSLKYYSMVLNSPPPQGSWLHCWFMLLAINKESLNWYFTGQRRLDRGSRVTAFTFGYDAELLKSELITTWETLKCSCLPPSVHKSVFGKKTSGPFRQKSTLSSLHHSNSLFPRYMQ